MATDWERVRANRYSKEPPPRGWNWPENIRPISLEGLNLFAVEPDTNKLFWNGKEIVLKDSISLDWPERMLGFGLASCSSGGERDSNSDLKQLAAHRRRLWASIAVKTSALRALSAVRMPVISCTCAAFAMVMGAGATARARARCAAPPRARPGRWPRARSQRPGAPRPNRTRQTARPRPAPRFRRI